MSSTSCLIPETSQANKTEYHNTIHHMHLLFIQSFDPQSLLTGGLPSPLFPRGSHCVWESADR